MKGKRKKKSSQVSIRYAISRRFDRRENNNKTKQTKQPKKIKQNKIKLQNVIRVRV